MVSKHKSHNHKVASWPSTYLMNTKNDIMNNKVSLLILYKVLNNNTCMDCNLVNNITKTVSMSMENTYTENRVDQINV